MRTHTLEFNKCPVCHMEVQVGVLRCINGHWIYWTDQHQAQKRKKPYAWGEMYGRIHFRGKTTLSARTGADDTSSEIQALAPSQVVQIVDMSGDFYLLKSGGYVHHTHVILHTMPKPRYLAVVNADGATRGSHDQPYWPSTVVHTFAGGEIVTVFGVINGFARLTPYSDEWFHAGFLTRVLYRAKVNADGVGRGSLDQPAWPAGVVQMFNGGEEVVVLAERDGYCLISATRPEWLHSMFLEKIK